MQDQKNGIINALQTLATPKVAEPITDLILDVGLENVTLEGLLEIENVSKQSAEKVIAAIEIHNILESTSRRLSEPKKSVSDKYREENTLSDRIKTGEDVAELRINSSGSKPMSWSKIRQKLQLKNDEFHKVIRLEDHFMESCIKRIESFSEGWFYEGKISVLLGFEPDPEQLARIEARKPLEKIKAKKSKDSKPKAEKSESESKSQKVKESKPPEKGKSPENKPDGISVQVKSVKSPIPSKTKEVDPGDGPTEAELQAIQAMQGIS